LNVDWTKCPKPLWDHQKTGVMALLDNPAYALFDEVGVGKSAQTVTALCAAHEAEDINAAIIVSPAFVRSVWASPDPLLGEFVKWVWPMTPYVQHEYAAHNPRLPKAGSGLSLEVVTTNYEFLRVCERDSKPPVFTHLRPLIEWAIKRKTWLILDEAWALSNSRAKQTRAIYLLRQACKRVTILNGTPGTPEALFPQFQILDPKILDVANYFHFRSKFCVTGGFMNKKIVGYQRMDEFKARTQPYALRREAADCLDLPPVLPPLTIEARLSPRTWGIYTQMRDELLAYLDSGEVTVAAQAGVRTMRLAQILAGFVGGVEGEPDLFTEEALRQGILTPKSTVREIGREKLDAILQFVDSMEPAKLVVWTRFRDEAFRMADEFRAAGKSTYLLVGGQDKAERTAAQSAFAPGTTISEKAILVGHPAAGGAGINLSAAHLAIYATNGFSLKDRLQSEGRINRPGQTRHVQFCDVIAVGPKGQKTLDHAVVDVLRNKKDVASWTVENWRAAVAGDE